MRATSIITSEASRLIKKGFIKTEYYKCRQAFIYRA
ncbi:hypothetical protein GECvBN6_gp140c [Salmonella phage GEC_vB_N6]|uniref:Uncharacterized protein n=4 Tax=Caudoviricetes TaxID=2731619 RepID=A0A2H5BPG1_9CAUD|nr:hypothetical protein HYP55_gp165 [Salmonella phage Mutine]AUG88220.1 hypothetical protein CPT_Mutine_088 [Salmonella phage Mutine]QPI14463.1 hypothetical protein GECvBGOT_gp128c [Salmonella phage GEC_vB_GOT]QPI15343.1 hypothetical protein GECvBN6_gp140c [Salmonella phage GEC_vB_N6]WNM70746.1 hypothetical protein CPT_Mansal_084 [Salmonella phage Mansal]